MFIFSMPPRDNLKRSGDNKPCFHCYRTGHLRNTKCPNTGLVSCTSCFKLNVFTNKCNCKNIKKPNTPQVLRIISNHGNQKWYLDLQLNDKIVPAFLNPGISRSRVNPTFANWWQSTRNESVYRDTDTIMLTTVRKGFLMKIPCEVIDAQREFIILGMEFMTAAGYTLTMEGVSIHSKHSPVLSSPYETEYVFNLPSIGKDLRTYLQRRKFFLKKGRIVKPSLRSSDLTVTVRRWSQSSRDASENY